MEELCSEAVPVACDCETTGTATLVVDVTAAVEVVGIAIDGEEGSDRIPVEA